MFDVHIGVCFDDCRTAVDTGVTVDESYIIRQQKNPICRGSSIWNWRKRDCSRNTEEIDSPYYAFERLPQKQLSSTTLGGKRRGEVHFQAIKEWMYQHLRAGVKRTFSRSRSFTGLDRVCTLKENNVETHVVLSVMELVAATLTAKRLYKPGLIRSPSRLIWRGQFPIRNTGRWTLFSSAEWDYFGYCYQRNERHSGTSCLQSFGWGLSQPRPANWYWRCNKLLDAVGRFRERPTPVPHRSFWATGSTEQGQESLSDMLRHMSFSTTFPEY